MPISENLRGAPCVSTLPASAVEEPLPFSSEVCPASCGCGCASLHFISHVLSLPSSHRHSLDTIQRAGLKHTHHPVQCATAAAAALPQRSSTPLLLVLQLLDSSVQRASLQIAASYRTHPSFHTLVHSSLPRCTAPWRPLHTAPRLRSDCSCAAQ
jgi:hypothetical protein